jgi:hypothetical protein
VAFTSTITRIVSLLLKSASSAWHRNDEPGFAETDIVLQFFSTVEAQGANGRFQVRDRDGAMTGIGRETLVRKEFKVLLEDDGADR